jgi:16S rRNA (uracil1498-N3)-methyltransferase
VRQFILPEDWDGGPACRIVGGRARYLARVLRLSKGEVIAGLDSAGGAWECRVEETAPGLVLLSVAPAPAEAAAAAPGRGTPAEEPWPHLVLAQGLPKGAKMDLVIRQATEAGVSAVLPLLTSRAVPREGGGEEGGQRAVRWERIVREARQQSGSRIRTAVSAPIRLEDLPAALKAEGLGPEDPKILFHEAPLAQSSLHGYLSQVSGGVALCVGPEGGFAPEELDFLLDAGFRPIRLAGAVLRAETAALFAIAAAQIILSERSSWTAKPL